MICKICGADESKTRIINSKKYGVLCRKHYLQMYRHGEVFRTIMDPNDIIPHEEDGYAEVVLRNKIGEVTGIVKIDLEDVDKVSQHKWHITKAPRTSYAATHIDGNTKLFLHRFVLDYYGVLDVDHINHDGMDDRKENLRIITHSANLTNQYRVDKGVKQVPSGRYQASIMQNGIPIYLGTFDTKEDALFARESYEAKYVF